VLILKILSSINQDYLCQRSLYKIFIKFRNSKKNVLKFVLIIVNINKDENKSLNDLMWLLLVFMMPYLHNLYIIKNCRIWGIIFRQYLWNILMFNLSYPTTFSHIYWQIFRIKTHGWRKWRTTALSSTIGSEKFQKFKYPINVWKS
jgi:hypothetical protein